MILCVLHFLVLPYYDNHYNKVLVPGPYNISNHARNLHDSAFVADMHTDSLLWGRDLGKRHARGHVDLPRLQEGGVDLQIFSAVTRVPDSLNYMSNSDETDSLPLLFLAAWRSPATWFDPKARSLVLAEELRNLTGRTPLTLVLHRNDLYRDGVKALLSLEGMHALGGSEDMLDVFHAAGYRMMGLAHFFDNEVAGSAHGTGKHGLTELGRNLIPRMEALGITIDLAHASTAAIDDTLALATRPVVVSHSGVKGTCQGIRNLSDDHLRGIAATGGVIGIGYWKSAVCEASVKGIVRAILHVIKVAGVDHVALGSDFDGHVAVPFDTTGLPLLTQALLAADLSEDDVLKVLGGNVRRVLESNLPE